MDRSNRACRRGTGLWYYEVVMISGKGFQVFFEFYFFIFFLNFLILFLFFFFFYFLN